MADLFLAQDFSDGFLPGDRVMLAAIPETVTRLFALVLNPMRDRVEALHVVAASEDRLRLEEFWRGEMVPPYLDDRWHKVHREGGPLEWYNQPIGFGGDPAAPADDYGFGIVELAPTRSWSRVA